MLYNLTIFELIALSFGFFSLILIFVLWRKMSRLQNFQQRFLSGTRGADLEETILTQDQDLKKIVGDVKKLVQANKILADLHLQCVQKIGMVRFSAFDGEGGNQSFAISLLDAHGNGVVMSSIYGRDSQRIYSKPVKNWQSDHPLTDEEKQAILQNQGGNAAPSQKPAEKSATVKKSAGK